MRDEPIDPDVDLHVEAQRAEVTQRRMTLPVIALGGAVGAAARHGLDLWWPVAPGDFPWATFAANVSGCLLIGVLMVVVQETSAAHPLVRPFLGAGVLGGFTTFSTYAVQAQGLISASRPTLALVYLFATLGAALLAVLLGLTVARLAAHRHWRRPATASTETVELP